MGLTESDPILESGRFVKPANYEWRNTSQSVVLISRSIIKLMYLIWRHDIIKIQHTTKKQVVLKAYKIYMEKILYIIIYISVKNM